MAELDDTYALHYSQYKCGVDQIPVEVLVEWGDVFTYGEEKYARDNWLKGGNWHEFYGSALRHLFAFVDGEEFDPESGVSHLVHAIWNLGALRVYQIHGLGQNDIHIKDRAVYAFDDNSDPIDTGQFQSLVETVAEHQRETERQPW